MGLQQLINEAIELKNQGLIESDLGNCQIELNNYLITKENAKPKVIDKIEKVDCEYCGRKYDDTGCLNHPNPCKKYHHESR